MSRQPTSVRRRIAQHDPGADRFHIPAPLASDDRREPPIPIDRSEQALNIDQLRLELHDQKGTGRRLECQHVDHAALPVDRERGFRSNEPVRRAQPPRDRFMHGRVSGIDHAVQLAAAPPRIPFEPDVERPSYPHGAADDHAVNSPTLNAGDDLGRHARQAGDIGLTQAAPKADRSEDSSDPHPIHGRSMARAAYGPITPGLSGLSRSSLRVRELPDAVGVPRRDAAAGRRRHESPRRSPRPAEWR